MDPLTNVKAAPALPGYTIDSCLGRGGMGIVWKARQQGTNRLVAVKMIQNRGRIGKSEMIRFQHEAELISQVQDPHIVQIFHTGKVAVETKGRVQRLPYLVMEYVGGGTLAERMYRKKFSPREAAQMMQTIAQALGRIHNKGIIHRDLKPANVLMTEDDHPKVSDFGLAISADRKEENYLKAVGTVEYMAPEQARGGSRLREIGASADVFAMGVMLYEMLAGTRPFHGDTRRETLNRIWDARPQFTPEMERLIPAELKAICLRCLSKDPDARYVDGEALALELGRFLRGETIEALPVGPLPRAWKWGRRNRVAALLLVGLTAAILVGTTATGIAAYLAAQRADEADYARDVARNQTLVALDQKSKADDARTQVEIERDQVKTNLYQSLVIAADRAFERRDYKAAVEALEDCPEPWRQFEWFVRHANAQGARAVLDHGGFAASAAYSPNGEELITCGGEGQSFVRFWDAQSGQLRDSISVPAKLASGEKPVEAQIGLGGKWVAIRTSSIRLMGQPVAISDHFAQGKVYVFERKTKQLTKAVPGSCFALSPDGSQLAVGLNRKIQIFDLAEDKVVRTFDTSLEVFSVGWQANGKAVTAATRIYTVIPSRPPEGGERSEYCAWYLETGKPEAAAQFARPLVWTVAALIPRVGLVAAGNDDKIEVFPAGSDTAQTKPSEKVEVEMELVPGLPPVKVLLDKPVKNANQQERKWLSIPAQFGSTALAIRPDGKRLAVGCRDGLIRIFDLADGSLLLVLNGHRFAVRSIAYSPDGSQLLSAGGDDGTVRVWNAEGQLGGPELFQGAKFCAFDPTSSSAAVAVGNGEIAIWDLGTRRKVSTLPARVDKAVFRPEIRDLAYRADGKLGIVYSDGQLRTWDLEKSKIESEVKLVVGEVQQVHPEWEDLTASLDQIRVWVQQWAYWKTQSHLETIEPNFYCISRDGRWVACFHSPKLDPKPRPPDFLLMENTKIAVFSTADGTSAGEMNLLTPFSPKGFDLDSVRNNAQVRIRTPNSGEHLERTYDLKGQANIGAILPRGGNPSNSRIAEIPDGKGAIFIRDRASNRHLITLTGVKPYHRAVFSPDGRFLAAFTALGIDLYDAGARAKTWNGK